jgi:hypothetical protein
MSFELKDNSGSIWVNDRKEKETHPDRTGTVKVGGVEYYISGWLRGANGKKYMSLAFKVKEPKQEQAAPAISGNSFDDDMSSIPF